jgi:hypothetical protein
MGEVFLSAPAPAGGALVNLSSNSPFASVPKKVWVYDRESSATFNIKTQQVTSLTTVTISATYGVTVSASLTIVVSAKLRLDTGLVAPPRTTTLPGTVPANPQFTDIVGGASPAPLNLQITTSNGQPWSTYDTSPWFDVRPTFGASGGITTLYPHTANLGAGTYTQPLRISTPGVPDFVVTVTLVMTSSGATPPASLAGISVAPTSVVGGSTSQGTVTLTSAAPSGGAVVSLSSSNTGVATVPGSVTVPSGATSATFTASTVSVSSSTIVSISGSYGGVSRSASLTVNSRAVTLSAISLIPTSLIGGSTAQGTATLSGPAPAGGAIVPLSSSNVAAATMPASVTVPAASTSATFTISTSRVSALTSVSLSGSYGGVSRSASLTVNPTTPSGGITANPANPQFNGTVGGAFPARLNLQITTSNGQPWSTFDTSPWFDARPAFGASGAAATLYPQTVGLSAGTYTQPIRVSSAGLPDLVVNVTLVMTGSGTPQPPSLSAISVAPTTVIGGTSSQGTVTLTAAAPAGGVVVSLSSTNPRVATVPASVTVPVGSTSATCNVTTSVVTSTSSVTISGSYAGVTRGSGLMVQQAGSPPPTGCPGFVIEGFGRDTVGGCGGTVYRVTNTNDSGPGSLRDFLNRPGPRIIKFAVSGTIVLQSDLEVTKPFLTIDGSDAPNGGICISNAMLSIGTNNVIVRYIRIRPGNPNPGVDCIQIYNSSDVVIDHCSLSWGSDENLDLASSNVTIQWCIISENMGTGAVLIYYGNPSVTLHHNLFAHSGGARHPEIGIGSIDFVNNVIYDWQAFGTTAIHAGCATPCGGGPVHANFVGNYYKPGAESTNPPAYSNEIRLIGSTEFAAQSSAYVQGNISPNRPNDTLPQLANVWQDNGGLALATGRFGYPAVTTTSATQAYSDVMANAGARLPCLDSVDSRILTDVQNGTGGFIDDPSQVGGWPDLTLCGSIAQAFPKPPPFSHRNEQIAAQPGIPRLQDILARAAERAILPKDKGEDPRADATAFDLVRNQRLMESFKSATELGLLLPRSSFSALGLTPASVRVKRFAFR